MPREKLPSTVTQRLRTLSKLALRRVFELAQRGGLDVLPRHFYSEIPDIAALRATDAWRRAHTMAGVNGSGIPDQLAFVAQCCSPGITARLGQGTEVHRSACLENGANGYGPIESLFLYCFVATSRPARVIQIGAGVSTAVMLRAATEADHRAQIICVDPYPTAMLKRLAATGDVDLIDAPAQSLAPDVLARLDGGDLLFIDSTHTVKPGSEVNQIVLEVLPRLPSGVFVHFHDIRFPYNYSPHLLYSDIFFWNESDLVLAFLTQNPSVRICTSLSMLHNASPTELQTILPAYRPARFVNGLMAEPTAGGHYPSALFLQTM